MNVENIRIPEDSPDRLSTPDDWRAAWGKNRPMLTFDPNKPFFRDLHKMLARCLPVNPDFQALEIGCYPGTYLWYFNKYFKYQMAGIEYVPECASRCRDYMRELGLDVTIYQADVFDFAGDQKWDMVFSVGLIEHFKNTDDIIAQHLKLLKPGGYLMLIIPHHGGLNGWILKMLNEKLYAIHNHMGYEAIEASLCKVPGLSIIEGGYYGRLGFWNADLYPALQRAGKIPYFIGRVIFYSIERVAQYIMPNTRFFAPNCLVVARKDESVA